LQKEFDRTKYAVVDFYMEFNDKNIPIIDKDSERERMEKMNPFLVVDFLRTQVSGT
jgi:hypothetical protein